MNPDHKNDPLQPRVSVIIACRDVGRYIDETLASVRNQSLADLEIVVVDDRSTDDTRERVARHASEDARIVLLDGAGEGSGAARNLALAAARGDWLAIVDGDDFIHPRRLDALYDAAQMSGDDMVADNMIAFQDVPNGIPPYFLLPLPEWSAGRQLDLAIFIRSNSLFGRDVPLGYLKPLIRRTTLEKFAVRYDPQLRIGEDYDLIARLLANGARYRYFPEAFYFYRRHAASTSFRLRVADVEAMIAAESAFARQFPATDPAVRSASDYRNASLVHALGYSRVVADIRARNFPSAVWKLLSNIHTFRLFAAAAGRGIAKRLRRLNPIKQSSERKKPRAVLLSCGTPASTEALRVDLAGRNYDVHVFRADRMEARSVVGISPELALRLGNEAGAEILSCDHPDLIPDLSYALSPRATIQLVTR